MSTASSRRTVACLAAFFLVAGACSSPQGTEPDNSLLGKDKPRRGQRSDGAKEPGKGAAGKKPQGERTPDPLQPGLAAPAPERSAAAADSGAAKTETEVSSNGTDPRTATVLVTEPDPDAEKSGLPPDFADILSTRIEGLGARFRVTITFRGNVPQRMPDDKTYMVAGVGIAGEKDEEGYAFGASADQDGWKAYGGNKDSDGDFPGTMSVQGDTIRFTIPWAAIGGPRPFEWYSQQTWFRSIAGTTHYSLDNVPNEGPAKYPAA